MNSASAAKPAFAQGEERNVNILKSICVSRVTLSDGWSLFSGSTVVQPLAERSVLTSPVLHNIALTPEYIHEPCGVLDVSLTVGLCVELQ